MRLSIKIVLPFLVLLFIFPLTASAAFIPASFAPSVKKKMPTVVHISDKQIVTIQHQSVFGDPPIDEFLFRFLSWR